MTTVKEKRDRTGGGALKKDQNYADLSRLRWAAWGVINVEVLERVQRRNFINHVREELKLHGMKLECGGSTKAPFYRIYTEKPDGKIDWSTTSAKMQSGAFTKVCLDTLVKIDPEHAKQELEQA